VYVLSEAFTRNLSPLKFDHAVVYVEDVKTYDASGHDVGVVLVETLTAERTVKHSSHNRIPVSVSIFTADGSPSVSCVNIETRHLEIEVTADNPRSSGTNAASVALVALIRFRSRNTSPENAPWIDD
jgi:hypothetical protein